MRSRKRLVLGGIMRARASRRIAVPVDETGVLGEARTIFAARALKSAASGIWSFALPEAGLALSITPRTSGAFVHGIAEDGRTVTVTFKRFRTGALGLTVGTLLTASILEPAVGVVEFDITASRPTG